MADKASIEKQIEEARKNLESRPEWVKRTTHLEGSDLHIDEAQKSTSNDASKPGGAGTENK